jgi:probable biosynthetic protein (TIGR04098 family)
MSTGFISRREGKPMTMTKTVAGSNERDLDDLVSEQAINDSTTYFRHLREKDPVCWNSRWDGWIVTSHAGVTNGFRSKVLSSGGDSVLTLHQVRRGGAVPPGGAAGGTAGVVAYFFRHDALECIHVENYNRWIQRSGHDTNHGLRRATPLGFQVDHLDRVTDEHTPRRRLAEVRKTASLRTAGEPVPRARLALTYQVDPSRDLNGAGLLYFASYFSIVDWAVLRMWRALGRPSGSFLRRRVLDRQLCFFANADADDVIDIEVTTYRDVDGSDLMDVTLRHQDGGLLAVARQRIRDTTPP